MEIDFIAVSSYGATTRTSGVVRLVKDLEVDLTDRDVILDEMRSFTDVHVPRPDGTFYCMADLRAYTQDSVELANFLLRKALVVTVPGKEFGMEGYLRLTYSGAAKEIIEAVERMKWALDPNSPNEIYIGDRKMVRDWM